MKNFNMPDLKEDPPEASIVVPLTPREDVLIKAKPYQLGNLSSR